MKIVIINPDEQICWNWYWIVKKRHFLIQSITFG